VKNFNFTDLAQKSINKGSIESKDIIKIINAPDDKLLEILNTAWIVRKRFFKNNVRIHILNNVKSGGCQEDCKYCSQSIQSKNKDIIYPMKSEKEVLNDAGNAYRKGAFRYCMAFSGKELSLNYIKKIATIVKKIKKLYPSLEICVSAGFLDKERAMILKEAGTDRYNHNINTSFKFYKNICTTHDYKERIKTIYTAKNAGMTLCCGVIIGMGEEDKDIIYMLEDLKRIKPESIPVNFFIPVKGHRIKNPNYLTPQKCLKILCAFRLTLPETELRIAAGREYHLKSLQALALYPANSLFAEGYLTSSGDDIEKTKSLIKEAGFIIERIEI